MAILGCNFNINFGQTLAPGSSLCNTLRTKLHAWTESSVIVEFMVKFIWQHNLPVGSYHTFKMPPGRLDFWCSKGKKWDPPCNSKTKTQRSEPKWLLKYLIIPNFCAKFQPNRLITTFGPWNTFSDNDTNVVVFVSVRAFRISLSKSILLIGLCRDWRTSCNSWVYFLFDLICMSLDMICIERSFFIHPSIKANGITSHYSGQPRTVTSSYKYAAPKKDEKAAIEEPAVIVEFTFSLTLFVCHWTWFV